MSNVKPNLIDPFVLNYNPKPKVNEAEKFNKDFYSQDVMQYPRSKEYEYRIVRHYIDNDAKAKSDIANGTGFRIIARQNIKTNIKEPNSIFSTMFGQGLQDDSPFIDRYRCKCGKIVGKLNNRTVCPHCHTAVQYLGDNFEMTGWIIADNFWFIHQGLFAFIRNFIGKNDFDEIIKYVDELDQDGRIIPREYKNQEDEFKGIGMIGFHDRFDEVMEYYAYKHRNKPNKMAAYQNIMKHRDIVWCHSLPVYTLLLRPIKISDGHFIFEGNNQEYNIIATEVQYLNTKSTLTFKRQETLLYHIQMKMMAVTNNIDKMLAGKKGVIRSLFGGNYNFISRCVIIPDPSLKVDEISLPYLCVMEMLKEVIINVIHKTFNCSYMDAYQRWYEGLLEIDPLIVQMIETLISNNATGRGIPVLINRNPTIRYGSIMQMYCVKINTDSYAMGIPLQILTPLNADFDGDVLNCLWIINQDFLKNAECVFNPRNAMFIDRNDGYMQADMCHSRDTMLNLNNITAMAQDSYLPEEIQVLNRIKMKG